MDRCPFISCAHIVKIHFYPTSCLCFSKTVYRGLISSVPKLLQFFIFSISFLLQWFTLLVIYIDTHIHFLSLFYLFLGVFLCESCLPAPFKNDETAIRMQNDDTDSHCYSGCKEHVFTCLLFIDLNKFCTKELR